MLTILMGGLGFEAEDIELNGSQVEAMIATDDHQPDLSTLTEENGEFQGIYLDGGRLFIWIGTPQNPQAESTSTVESADLFRRANELGELNTIMPKTSDDRAQIHTVQKGTFCGFIADVNEFNIRKLIFNVGRTVDDRLFIDYDAGMTYDGVEMELTWDEEMWVSKSRYLLITKGQKLIYRSET